MTDRIKYQKPPQWSTGMVAGRSNLDIFRTNDQLWFGLAWRHANLPTAAARAPVNAGENDENCIWLGYHWLESDATLLNYKFGMETDGAVGKFYYNYGDDGEGTSEILIGTSTGDGAWGPDWTEGTYDLAVSGELTTGALYKVALENTTTVGTGHCYTPYTTYTNQEAYNFQTPYQLYDGRTSAPAHFNRLRNNDIYFDQTRPRQVAYSGVKQTYRSGTTEELVWVGWVKHRFHGLYYRVHLTGVSGLDDRIVIYYDYGGTNETSTEITSAGWSEDEWQIASGSSDISIGAWVQVRVTLKRDSSGDQNTQTATLNYLRLGPLSDGVPGSYVAMGEADPGQWVYGNTPGRDTRIDLFRTNDNYLFPRLNWNATTGRIDWAMQYPWIPGRTGTTNKLSLKRRGDLLTYRVTDATLEWGTDSSYALEDYDDTWTDAGVAYKTLDLNTVDDLAYGQTYYVTTEDGTLDYAMEK